MTNFDVILFSEPDSRQFLGYNRNVELFELPIWGNFRVNDILRISNIQVLPYHILSIANSEDVEKLLYLLKTDQVSENIIVGRTGNITVLDWLDLISRLKKPRGIVKIQVGKVPSELYCIRKTDLTKIVKDTFRRRKTETSLLDQLFERTLFYNFERIFEFFGYSFLLRNSYEYYQENLRIVERLLDNHFLKLYGNLEASSISNIIIGKGAFVKNSMLGNGTKINGTVEGSVIFSGVTIEKNTLIKNSVILPFNEIQEDVFIENALVLERKNKTIERDTIIGGNMSMRNGDFPRVLMNGLTIVGEGLTVPTKSRIGAGCLVHGFLEGSPSPIFVEDGQTARIQ
jgi:ADP-glucose pyrophosphorylase